MLGRQQRPSKCGKHSSAICVNGLSLLATTTINNHKLRSVDFMTEKLSGQFPKNASKLYEKEKEIARYNKVLCRRLEAINDKGEKMLKQVDEVTNQQV